MYYTYAEEYDKMAKKVIDIYLDYGICDFPINIEAICKSLLIKLMPFSEFPDCISKISHDAFCIPRTSNNPSIIIYNEKIKCEERIRFSICHEIKHIIVGDKIETELIEKLADYFTVGTLSSNPNVQIIMQNSDRVKAPEYSHTENRIYAVIKNGTLKHLAYYDVLHDQAICIDLVHDHHGVQPHCHFYLNHGKDMPGFPVSKSQIELINKIKKEFKLL